MVARWVPASLAVLVVAVLLFGTPFALHPSTGPGGAAPASASVSTSIAPLAAPNPYSNGMAASIVLGAPNFTSAPYIDPGNASQLYGDPEWATPDAHGNLWTTDFRDARVLEFPAPFHNGENATIVIGQSTFNGSMAGTTATNLTNPAAIAFDAHGDLFVSDYENNRVLEYPAPLTTGEAATVVIGQTSFTVNTAGNSVTTLSHPTGLSFDSQGDLWVADSYNNRVLEFRPPFSTGMAASVVVGQSDFTGDESDTTAVNLSYPISTWVGDGMLWVADDGNSRVVGYPTPVTTGEAATEVLGQADLTSTDAAGPTAMDPASVMLDAQGNLWVSDIDSSRVLEYPAYPGTNATPIRVIGQSNLNGEDSGTTRVNLSGPIGAYASPSGLWVTDAGNDRILEYVPTTFAVHVTESGLPSGTSWSATFDNSTAYGVGSSLAFSGTNGTYPLYVTPVPGYLADPSYSSVVVNGSSVTVHIAFATTSPNPFSNGMPASVVLGQSSFWNTLRGPPMNASNFIDPGFAMAFDSHGDLWVADYEANRVLEFVPPFTDGMAASLVLGQSSFTGYYGGASSTNLSEPDGLAFDAHGNLWVADFGNNRVVEYTAPFSTGEAASAVLGQTTLSGYQEGTSAVNLSGPALIAFDGSVLWVTDYYNNRVVAFPGPLVTGEAATIVLGQSNFVGNGLNTTATNMSQPAGISFDSAGNLWVSDYGNNRALEFLAPLTTGEAAGVVLGQANFTTADSTGPNSFDSDNGVTVAPNGNVWVADTGNNRVLEFQGPAFFNNQTPTLVIGQGNFSSYDPSLGPSGLYFPNLAIFDSHGNLWIDDSGNGRVLGYIPAEYTVTFHAIGTSTPASWNLTVNGVAQTVSGTTTSLVLENGTFTWNASGPAGWIVGPGSGTWAVNGAGVTLNLSFIRVTYSLTFSETGLTAGTTWSVVLNGVTETGTGTTIVFTEVNGTYGYTIGTVSGYNAPTPASGSIDLAGSGRTVAVTFTAVSTSSSSPSSDWIYIVIAVVVIAAVIAALLLMRRKKPSATNAPPAQWNAPTPPPGAAGQTVAPPPPPPPP